MSRKYHLPLSNLIPVVLGILLLALFRIQSASPIALFNDEPSQPGSAITFEDIRQKSGLDFILNNSVTSRKYSIETMAGGVALFDYNKDGRLDIFFTNGAHLPDMDKSNPEYFNRLFRNNGDGTFTDVTERAGANGTAYAMGVAAGDYDNDGHPDVFQTAMYGDTFPLFKNLGDGFFNDIREASGIARQSSRLTAWGNGIFDFDNDGFKDIFTANAAILDTAEMAHNLPSKLPNALFRNAGNGTFQDVSLTAGREFINPSAHRGAAFGDFNNDGRIDIVVTSLNSSPQLFKNTTMIPRHWLLLQLVGIESNRDGVGAQVKIATASGVQYNQATTAVGYNSSSDKRVHFGLGTVSKVDRIDIQWPSGIHQVLADIKADQVLMVKEQGERKVPLKMQK